VGYGLGDHKIKEPLHSGGYSDIHGAKSSGGNLGDEDPAYWIPAELKESSKEEDAFVNVSVRSNVMGRGQGNLKTRATYPKGGMSAPLTGGLVRT